MSKRNAIVGNAIAAICCAMLGGCAGMKTTGKVVATPITVVRDAVDMPLVTVTNVFEYFADQTRIAKAPHAGVGWSLGRGIRPSIGYDLSHFLWKGISWMFGSVDYVIGRSIWPNYPNGVSPWRAEEQSWGSLYFPSTRVLWGDNEPLYKPEKTGGEGVEV